MPLTAEQKRVVESVVGIFETGKSGGGDAAAVTRLKDHAGITYGIRQATDAAGSLDAIVVEYQARRGRFATELASYLPRLARNESVTSGEPWVAELESILARAGREDPIMGDAQRAVFDRVYWDPMSVQAESAGLRLPLSWAALYDTAIQSGPAAIHGIRASFPEACPANGGDERWWAFAYIRARDRWLSGFVGKDDDHTREVRRSVYRPRSLLALATAGKWDLGAPVSVPLGNGFVVVR